MSDDTATVHVEIKGEMSIFTALAVRQQLLDALEQPGAATIEVDLASVSEVDSAGIQLLIAAKREAALHARAAFHRAQPRGLRPARAVRRRRPVGRPGADSRRNDLRTRHEP